MREVFINLRRISILGGAFEQGRASREWGWGGGGGRGEEFFQEV